MKELTIEQKAQRYDEALERARKCLDEKRDTCFVRPDVIFPELAESEDERIRKGIIRNLKYLADKAQGFVKDELEERIAWLEKQDIFSKKDIDDAYLKGVRDTKNEIEKQYEANYQIRKDIATFIFNYKGDIKDRAKWMNYLGIKVSFVEKQGEQKPDDKVEIKFKVGDWIIRNAEGFKHNTYLVTEVRDYYVCEELKGRRVTFTFNDVHKNFRLWDITKDAKNGDVLVTVDDEYPFIYKGCLDPKHPDSPVAYCGINTDGYFHSCSNKFNHWWTEAKVHPATKEQKDALLKAMADAGWEFDFEKKELKGIEKKSVSITDEWIEDYWQHHKVINPYSYDKGEEIQFDHQGFVGFCKKYCKKPAAWSEEDEHRVKDTIYFLDTAKKHYASVIELDACIDWLKSLKKRLQK